MTDATPRAWAYLSRVAEPPCAELAALVRRVGPVEAAERVRRGDVDESLARHTDARREIDRAAEDLDLLARRGGRLISPDDDEWPLLAFAAFGGARRQAAGQAAAGVVGAGTGATRRHVAAVGGPRRYAGLDHLR